MRTVTSAGGTVVYKYPSLVSFMQMGPVQVISLVNDVLTAISPHFKCDPRGEPPPVTAARICDALKVLTFQFDPPDLEVFQEKLQIGDSRVIYPILLFLLCDLEKHKLRAYVARFLRPVNVPDYMKSEECFLQYQEARETFKAVHKQVSSLRDSIVAFNKQKQELVALNDEKAKLNEKIDVKKKKLELVPNSAQLLSGVLQLMAQRNERYFIESTTTIHQDRLARAKAAQTALSDTLTFIQRAAESGTERYMAQMQEEVQAHRYEHQRMQYEINEMRERKSFIGQILESQITESMLAAMQQEKAKLRQTIKVITDRRVSQPGDEQLHLLQQQYATSEKQKVDLATKLKQRRVEAEQTRRDHEEMLRQLEAKGGKLHLLDESAFQNFVLEVRKTGEKAKAIKVLLADLNAEQGVLIRTKDILVNQHPTCPNFVAELERSGVHEPKSIREVMGQVSLAKQKADQSSAQKLLEISRYVTDISTKLQEKKVKISQLAKQLKAARAELNDVETMHSEKKAEYEKLTLQIRDEKSRLAQEHTTHMTQWMAEQSNWHLLNCRTVLASVQLHKATTGEREITELYSRRLIQITKQIEETRSRQATIKKTEQSRNEQRQMLTDLKQLLSLKLSLTNANSTTSPTTLRNPNPSAQTATTTTTTTTHQNGTDRMVL
ncbi:intraflagellar transport protein 81-like [Pelomyxa schiedti]|nr:intraflagellar transport protein 81-like [Pelomyxa schiedti]